jgi:hypothetical protein
MLYDLIDGSSELVTEHVVASSPSLPIIQITLYMAMALHTSASQHFRFSRHILGFNSLGKQIEEEKPRRIENVV